jgi:hypothetical protein
MLTSERQSLDVNHSQTLDRTCRPVSKLEVQFIQCLNLTRRLNCPTVLHVQRLAKKLSLYNAWLDFIFKIFLYAEAPSNTKFVRSISWWTLDFTVLRLSIILQKQFLFFLTLYRTQIPPAPPSPNTPSMPIFYLNWDNVFSFLPFLERDSTFTFR